MQCTKGMNGWYGANKCPPRDPTTHGSFASPGTQQCRKNGINAKLNCPRPVGAPLAVPGAVRRHTAPAQSSEALNDSAAQ